MIDRKKSREDLLELAKLHGIQIEGTKYDDTFVSHRNHRIFFTWHPTYQEWFFIVHKTGVAASLLTGYPTLGSRWFKSWDAWHDGITWGKQLIDCEIPD